MQKQVKTLITVTKWLHDIAFNINAISPGTLSDGTGSEWPWNTGPVYRTPSITSILLHPS